MLAIWNDSFILSSLWRFTLLIFWTSCCFVLRECLRHETSELLSSGETGSRKSGAGFTSLSVIPAMSYPVSHQLSNARAEWLPLCHSVTTLWYLTVWTVPLGPPSAALPLSCPLLLYLNASASPLPLSPHPQYRSSCYRILENQSWLLCRSPNYSVICHSSEKSLLAGNERLNHQKYILPPPCTPKQRHLKHRVLDLIQNHTWKVS